MGLSWLGFATCEHGNGYKPPEQPEARCHKCREAKLAAEIRRLRARLANRDATIRRLGDWEAYEAQIEMMVDALPVERAGRSWHNDHEAVENTVASYEAELARWREYAEWQFCECYTDYGRRLPEPCERCQLLYGHKTWEEVERGN